MREHDLPGNFIVIEGPDGAGTTTQSKKLAEALDAYYTREPTDMETGEKVDKLISSSGADPVEVAKAFAEDRGKHVEEEIVPRLETGETVVSDRYYHSSLTYQPVMGADFENVKEMNQDFLRPDLTVVLQVDSETGMSRVSDRGLDGHIFEELSFQEKVSQRYLELDQRLDEEIVYINASEAVNHVFSRVESTVRDRLGF